VVGCGSTPTNSLRSADAERSFHHSRHINGFEPEQSPEKRERRDERDRNRERDHFIDQVFAEYRAGARGNSWASIQARANQSASPMAEYAWIYERVSSWPRPGLADRIAQELLPLLLAGNRSSEALRITKARLQANERFRPITTDRLLRLVELARDAGDRPLARTLLSDFDRHHPGDPAALRARRLAEELTR